MIFRTMIKLIVLLFLSPVVLFASEKKSRFKVLVLSEEQGHHAAFDARAKLWLKAIAQKHKFHIDYIRDTKSINKDFLRSYRLFIQLDYPPYNWTQEAVDAFEDYIEEGKGGWIGFHHATLLGEFDGFPMWKWFSNFMGGVRFKNYIADFASAKVNVEQTKHPVMKNIPVEFLVEKEEWYTYDKSPRANVEVIASVDESTYQPETDIKMGDHPVIWSNPKYKARNVYIFMGHAPELFNNKPYTQLVENAIFWAASIKR
jgi:type 1 glutamine amidotransferase